MRKANITMKARPQSPSVDAEVAGVRPTQLVKFLPECADKDDEVLAYQQTNPALPLGLLRARRERPRCRRAAEKRDELAASDHSMTSSASESRLSEILTPSAFAVVRLMTNSNFVDCITGRSAGFAPLRIWPV